MSIARNCLGLTVHEAMQSVKITRMIFKKNEVRILFSPDSIGVIGIQNVGK
ncbi:hypothetical protein DBT_2135 [Dissulfuribacter thermophilus]|uniref:Uncharacterized protein n=1 Tax=Dissulfuribacter thermophilus TaxID=1156395 RepID=A0A1B9F398_9BACT|nr:hypothetical protein DBT_2135 [Dissulfuribacter thermophilus]